MDNLLAQVAPVSYQYSERRYLWRCSPPPPTKTRFSLLPQASWPPWTNNSLILCTTADLIVSLWRESPELHSVKWQMVHQQRAGQTSPAPAQAHRWAPTLLPVPWDRTQGKHGRKRETRIFTLLHLSANASLILSPSLAPSLLTETAAANTCTVQFILVSHLFSATVTLGLFCFIINVHRVTCPVQLYGLFSLS